MFSQVCGEFRSKIKSHRQSVVFFMSIFCFLSLSQIARAQSAALNGMVMDPSGAMVPKAKVTLTNTDTNTPLESTTNKDGLYSLPYVRPGNYTLTVDAEGFSHYEQTGIIVGTAQNLALNVRLKIGGASQSVTVDGRGNGVGTTNDSSAVSLTVTREFVASMPLNGRSFQDLIQLAPGAVATSSTGSPAGYYSINGQRADGNNFTVDGVSTNLGGFSNWSSNGYGAAISGSTFLNTALGTTQSLASIDSLQEFTIQTSGYTAEYGRSPGGQVQFSTRSGTNTLHGTLFDYLRNTVFDANSYYNNYYGLAQTPEHQNDFGGTIGGPLIVPKFYDGKNKTFYFFSYEGLRLTQPAFESEYVPTQAFRSWASPGVRPFLTVAPLPNSPDNQDGCSITDPATGKPAACDALFNYSFSNSSSMDNISVRLDQTINKRLQAFVRYADTPSSEVTGGDKTSHQAINTHMWTAGLTANITNSLLDELRFNFSHEGSEYGFALAPIAGASPFDRSLMVPAQYESPYDYVLSQVQVPGTSLSYAAANYQYGTVQRQYQIVDSLTWVHGRHTIKIGEDWRRLTPTFSGNPYTSEMSVLGLTGIQQGKATGLIVESAAPGKPILDNLSLYAQDHWKISPRFGLDYGVRWEFNPPPGPFDGYYPVALTSSDLASMQIAPSGTPPYKTNYHSFAPRLGFTWNAVPSQSHAVTVRGGFGIFFDTGQGASTQPYTMSYPFEVSRATQLNVPLPFSAAALAPPSLGSPLVAPYANLIASDPNLTIPYAEQWNLSVDEMLSPANTLTVSYVGNNGRKLIFTEEYATVPGNPAFTSLHFTNNGSQSNYNAFQVQDVGRVAKGLTAIASFTWAHALDNSSNDYSTYAPMYGNSDYDLRRVLNLALNYRTPTLGTQHWIQIWSKDWVLSNRFATQSGYPITNIYQATAALPDGTEARYVPDLVPGVPIYLHGAAAAFNGKAVPGGWRLNPAAFSCVPTNTGKSCSGTPIRNGDLGRNYVRNPSFYALNTSLQRTFPVYDQLRMNLRVEAFNILNHPNLGNPDVSLTDTTFGQLVEGGTTTIGSSNQLYSMGAARSLQFSLHLQF